MASGKTSIANRAQWEHSKLAISYTRIGASSAPRARLEEAFSTVGLRSCAAPGDAAGPPPLLVAVHLTDPAALYARQRTRTLLFGSLIALSAGAVLAGFVTAWRAFRQAFTHFSQAGNSARAIDIAEYAGSRAPYLAPTQTGDNAKTQQEVLQVLSQPARGSGVGNHRLCLILEVNTAIAGE